MSVIKIDVSLYAVENELYPGSWDLKKNHILIIIIKIRNQHLLYI